MMRAESTEPEAISLRDELEQTLSRSKTAGRYSSGLHSLEGIIRKEMNLLQSGGIKGEHLQFVYNALLTVVPTSVEAERAFSAAGYLACKVRSRLADKTIDTLCFMRSYFQNNE